jgi:hypothetical protein
MRGFFRDHSFYVTQFPMTSSGDFGDAVRILYWTLKYLGAVELQKNFVAWNAHNTLWWMCSRRTMDEIDSLKGHTLEDVLHANVFRRLFNLPPNKRIDVEIYDPKPDPIQLIQDLREELWTPGQLFSYLDNSKYLLHIYDLGEYRMTHFLPINHHWFGNLRGTDGAVEVLRQIRHLDQLRDSKEIHLMGLPKSVYYQNPNPKYHSPTGMGWENFTDNVAFAQFKLTIKGQKSLKEGYIFSRSGRDSPELYDINHRNLRPIFIATTPSRQDYIHENDAERKNLLALYQYFKDDWMDLQRIELDIYSEDIPCESCTPILRRFREIDKNRIRVELKVYCIKTNGKEIETVRREIFNDSNRYHFMEYKIPK